MKYRKKPVVIEAIQWNGINLTEIKEFVGNDLDCIILDDAWKVGHGIPHVIMHIHTLEGDMKASRNDYIIKGVNGEFYPCKPDIFEKTYEISSDTVNYSNIYEKAINTYGENAQSDMVIEEMSELIKEICKKKRGKDNHDAIVEEIVDVEIMLEQLKIICDIDNVDLDNAKKYKINRLMARLEVHDKNE